jgi:phosphoribosylamine--glycine ligase
MHILIIGSGGREHTLAWKIAKSKNTPTLYFAPGNAGTSQYGSNLDIDVKDFSAIIDACIQNKIEMVVVGPEEPLVNGIYDALKNNSKTKHIIIIGPNKQAAQLEGSKSFAKHFMEKYKIPTAAYAEFNKDNYEVGVDYIKKQALPIVLKADGLAGGKGVVICTTYLEAIAEFEMMIKHSKFGEAGNKVVIEDFLDGIEFSVFAITDGVNYKILPIAKDYKRIGEGDTGLNTGGMGAISPVPFVDAVLLKKVEDQIIKPTIDGFKKEGFVYCGFVFFGLIKVENEPYVIEYNCRLGDPETEVILPRLKNDLLDIFIQTCNGTLENVVIETEEQYAAAIVVASGGYPSQYETGYPIIGLSTQTESLVFIAGAHKENEIVVTTSGRVLVITSLGNTLKEAVAKSKKTLRQVGFEKNYYRGDIGYEFDS